MAEGGYKAGMSMVILQGSFVLKPEDRDRFITASEEGMRDSRQEEGCLEYVMAADPLDPGRVVLSERWESAEHLQRHMERLTARRSEAAPGATRPTPVSQEVTVFDVAGWRSLGV